MARTAWEKWIFVLFGTTMLQLLVDVGCQTAGALPHSIPQSTLFGQIRCGSMIFLDSFMRCRAFQNGRWHSSLSHAIDCNSQSTVDRRFRSSAIIILVFYRRVWPGRLVEAVTRRICWVEAFSRRNCLLNTAQRSSWSFFFFFFFFVKYFLEKKVIAFSGRFKHIFLFFFFCCVYF